MPLVHLGLLAETSSSSSAGAQVEPLPSEADDQEMITARENTLARSARLVWRTDSLHDLKQDELFLLSLFQNMVQGNTM